VLGFVFLSWCVLVGGLSAVQHRGVHVSDVRWWPMPVLFHHSVVAML